MIMKSSIERCVSLVLVAIVGLLSASVHAQAPAGSGGAEVAPFDAEILALLKKYEVPGGAIAVARNGKLVISRGYGVADRVTRRVVLPDAPFRIASLTKPLVAIATLVLADNGRLPLDTPIASVLRARLPARTPPAEGLLARITVRNLVQHTSAWGPRENPNGGGIERTESSTLNRGVQGDVRDNFLRLGAAWTIPPIAEPGTQYAYSTFGYCALGSLLEAAEDRPIDALINDLVLLPSGVKRFGLAAPFTGEPRPLPDETRYYDPPNSPTWKIMVDGRSVPVPRPDGYWPALVPGACIAGGRLVLSAPDYLRVLTRAGGRRGEPLLSPARQALLFASSSSVIDKAGARVTHGLMFTPGAGGGTWWHTGGMPGTATYYSRSGPFEWVAMFNLQPDDRQLYRDVNAGMWRAIRAVDRWPDIDLF
jgi:N-acyl-D-amino-acid deacylase